MKIFILIFSIVIFLDNSIANSKQSHPLVELLLIDKSTGVEAKKVMRMAVPISAKLHINTREAREASLLKRTQMSLILLDKISGVTQKISDIIGKDMSPFQEYKSPIASIKKENNTYIHISDGPVIVDIRDDFDRIFGGIIVHLNDVSKFKRYILKNAKKEANCFVSFVVGDDLFQGGFIFAKYSADQSHVTCIERSFIKMLGLIGNEKKLNEMKSDTLEYKVLRDLYRTDKYIGKNKSDLSNISIR